MTLKELNEWTQSAMERAKDYEQNPDEVIVSLQIDDISDPHHGSVCTSDDVELHYDGDCQASGCVLTGWRDSKETQ